VFAVSTTDVGLATRNIVARRKTNIAWPVKTAQRLTTCAVEKNERATRNKEKPAGPLETLVRDVADFMNSPGLYERLLQVACSIVVVTEQKALHFFFARRLKNHWKRWLLASSTVCNTWNSTSARLRESFACCSAINMLHAAEAHPARRWTASTGHGSGSLTLPAELDDGPETPTKNPIGWLGLISSAFVILLLLRSEAAFFPCHHATSNHGVWCAAVNTFWLELVSRFLLHRDNECLEFGGVCMLNKPCDSALVHRSCLAPPGEKRKKNHTAYEPVQHLLPEDWSVSERMRNCQRAIEI
jgi:hypothetical protein